jgi:PPOX class probable F420-dependent enzyme
MNAVEREFLDGQRVARLATIAADGTPSLVPVCFAVIGEADPVIVSVLDEKPKSVPDDELARVRHIRRDPRVSLIADRWDEDWSRLAFVRVSGTARLVAPGDSLHTTAIAALRAKYPQYRAMAIERRPVVAIAPGRTSSWGL